MTIRDFTSNSLFFLLSGLLMAGLFGSVGLTPLAVAEEDSNTSPDVDVSEIMEKRIEALDGECPAVALYLLTGTDLGQGRRENLSPVQFLSGETSGLEGGTLGSLLTRVDAIVAGKSSPDGQMSAADSSRFEMWEEKVLLVDFSVDEYPASGLANLGDLNRDMPELVSVFNAYTDRKNSINQELSQLGCQVSPFPLLVGYSQGAGLSSRIAILDTGMREQAEEPLNSLDEADLETLPAACAGRYSIVPGNSDVASMATADCHSNAREFFVISDPYQEPEAPGNWGSAPDGLGLATVGDAIVGDAIVRIDDVAARAVPAADLVRMGIRSQAAERGLGPATIVRAAGSDDIRGQSQCTQGDLVCDSLKSFLTANPEDLLASMLPGRRLTQNLRGVAIHIGYDDDAEGMEEAAGLLVDRVEALILTHSEQEPNLRREFGTTPDRPVDVALVIDTTRSMKDAIAGVRREAVDIVDAVNDRPGGGRVAIVTYRDIYDEVEFVSRVECPFDDPYLIECIESIELAPENSVENAETVYSGVMIAINELSWSESVDSHIVLIGDSGQKDPEPNTGYTAESVARALRGGPNSAELGQDDSGQSSQFVLSALPQTGTGLGSLLRPTGTMAESERIAALAKDSGGAFYTGSSRLGSSYRAIGLGERGRKASAAVVGVIDDSQAARAHFPRSSLYASATDVFVGEEVLFSGAWSSYAGFQPIFEFDFDGDGNYEFRTSDSTVFNVFDAPGEYVVGLRITDEFGRRSVDTETLTVSAPLDSEELVSQIDTSFEGSVVVSPRDSQSGQEIAVAISGLFPDEAWGFRLVPQDSDDPWGSPPIYVSPVSSSPDRSGTDTLVTTSALPRGEYRVLVSTDGLRFADAGRLSISPKERVLQEVLSGASPGNLVAVSLSLLAFLGFLVALVAKKIRIRSRSQDTQDGGSA